MKVEKRTVYDILILLLVSGSVMLFGLGKGSLTSWDESIYAHISRIILESGDWVALRMGHEPWFDKPPLYMWVTAVFYRIFGINEFSARLLSVLSGMGTVLLVFLAGRNLFSRRAGFISALILLSTYHFIWFARMGSLDMTFTFLCMLSAVCFYLAGEKQIFITGFFVFFGLAFLTKGCGAVLIPLLILPYVLSGRKYRQLSVKYVIIGIVLFIVIVSSWYLPSYLRYGGVFLEEHFMKHVLDRSVRGLGEHEGSFLVYFNAILYKGKPWGIFGLVLFPLFIYRSVRERKEANYLVISWISVIIVFFSIVRTKLHWYIMPVYPALSLVAGWGIEKFLRGYSKILVIAVAVPSLVYFGTAKGLFSPDYNPDIKYFSQEVSRVRMENSVSGVLPRVYNYRVGDPGILYYLGGFSEYVHYEKELRKVIDKGVIVVARFDQIKHLPVRWTRLNAGWRDVGVYRVSGDSDQGTAE